MNPQSSVWNGVFFSDLHGWNICLTPRGAPRALQTAHVIASQLPWPLEIALGLIFKRAMQKMWNRSFLISCSCPVVRVGPMQERIFATDISGRMTKSTNHGPDLGQKRFFGIRRMHMYKVRVFVPDSMAPPELAIEP